MQNSSISPQVKHLVLVGGGHSHLFVLKRLGMQPVPGLSVTLISREIESPYSGAMPSYISGFCSKDSMHIDLRPLARFAGARLIHANVESIDLEAKTLQVEGRPPIEFDLLSLNIGSRPEAKQLLGAEGFACPVKPIDRFLARWENVREEAAARVRAQQEYSIVIVGGGPASVELALAMHYRIHNDCHLSLDKKSSLTITLISAASELLQEHNPSVRQAAMRTLSSRQIEVALNQRVSRFLPDSVQTEDGNEFPSDATFYATGASLPDWPQRSGLGIADDGFLDTLPTLQSATHEFVFVAGDAASIRDAQRPKSGVYAVRAGKPLAENLIRYATGRRLIKFHPQRQALALIALGDKSAIASRGKFSATGRAVWSIKQRIDSQFIVQFSKLPTIDADVQISPGLLDAESEATLRRHALRCAGCGAKVASGILNEVLEELEHPDSESHKIVRKPIEDASLIPLGDGRVLLQTIDQLSAFIDDPWLFGQIATNHALSDIYAMGAQPHSALAVVGIPLAIRRITKNNLRDLMRGSKLTLDKNNCELLGGHTAESPLLQFGLAVNGFASEDEILSKHTLQQGDVLILTKALGTGALFAADMRGRCANPWAEAAISQMLFSNKLAAECFREHGATSCTDVTGFGLAGHLFEMLEPSAAKAELELASIPALMGSLELLSQGLQSSLHKENRRAVAGIYNQEAFGNDPRFELLFDPQTAGGLLASLPENRADACLASLKALGHSDAAIIGRVTNNSSGLASIILK